MKEFENITACVLSYNRCEDLRRTLKALVAIEGLQVIVIDNASTDGTAEMLTTEFGATLTPLPASPAKQGPFPVGSHMATPRQATPLRSSTPLSPLHATLLEENIGISARNIFFQNVETDYLLTLDDDSWPRGGEDIERLLRTMEADPRIASVCAACVHPDTGVAETEGIERFASGGSAEAGYDVVNIAAGGSLFRMSAVRETMGYGEEFFWGREENDLAFQLLQRNWRVVFEPRAVIWHTLSPVGRQSYRRLEFVTRNSFWLLWKYFPLTVALPAALLFVLRRLLPIIKDVHRTKPVFRGISAGFAGMGARRRLSPDTRRFTLRESWTLRGWFFKLFFE